MSPVVRVCDEPGCSELIDEGVRCETHRAPRKPPELTEQRRIRSTKRWQRASRLARERDGNRCTWGLEQSDRGAQAYPDGRCPVVEQLDAHHVVPLEDGGAPYELENLRTLCRQHHARAESEGKRRRGRESGPLV